MKPMLLILLTLISCAPVQNKSTCEASGVVDSIKGLNGLKSIYIDGIKYCGHFDVKVGDSVRFEFYNDKRNQNNLVTNKYK